jgi:hypothetical protein
VGNAVVSCLRSVLQMKGYWMLLIGLRFARALVTQNLLLPTPPLPPPRLDRGRQSQSVLKLASYLVRERTLVSWGRRSRSGCA